MYALVPTVPGPVTAVVENLPMDLTAQQLQNYYACGSIVTVDWQFDGHSFRRSAIAAAKDKEAAPAQVIKIKAMGMLHDSDRTVLRCLSVGVAVPAEWISYRAALRGIVSTGTGPLPVMPAYPAGT